jgi:hypothetical protein
LSASACQRHRRKIPLDAMLQALPGLVDEGYGTVDKQVFALEPLDATARQLGASYQLRIAMNPLQESQVWCISWMAWSRWFSRKPNARVARKMASRLHLPRN